MKFKMKYILKNKEITKGIIYIKELNKKIESKY